MTASPAAYVTAVLHAFKHPSQPVFGLLIGKTSADGEQHVVAAVPIMHSEIASHPHPVTSIALRQVAAVCRSQGRVIVGAYFGNERLDDTSVNDHTLALLSFIAAGDFTGGRASQQAGNAPSLVVWQLINAKIHPSSGVVGVRTYSMEHRGNRLQAGSGDVSFARWNPDELKASIPLSLTAVLGLAGQLLEARKYTAVVDFEEHLECVDNDYFNKWAEQL